MLVVCLGVLIAGCGNSGSTSSSTASSGGESDSGKHLKIAWLYYGPKDDKGWGSAVSAGEEAVAEKFGDQVENVSAKTCRTPIRRPRSPKAS